jgi:hypothetical protein
MDMIQKIKKHFASLGYGIEINKHEAADIKANFTHDIIFLNGESSIRLFRLIQKYFGERIRVIGTKKTRVLLFHFNPDGHNEITGICKVCGCNDQNLCNNVDCYWTDQDLSDACNESLQSRDALLVKVSPAKEKSHKLQEQL